MPLSPKETIADAKAKISQLKKLLDSGTLTPEEEKDVREAIGDFGLSAVISDTLGEILDEEDAPQA